MWFDLAYGQVIVRDESETGERNKKKHNGGRRSEGSEGRAWEQAAEAESFVWSREVDLVVLRPLMTYWFNLAQMLADHPEYQPPGSIEARVFYRNLVAGVLAELVRQAPEEFTALRERWPQI